MVVYESSIKVKGPFNNYVNKMGEGRGGQKCLFLCPRSGFKICLHRGPGLCVSKSDKFLSP